MTEELKNALITIAEYMGMTVYGDGMYDYKGITYSIKYHTSADALLPVYRKVRDFDIRVGMGYDGALKRVSDLILYNDYPTACIKLAEIIKQLK